MTPSKLRAEVVTERTHWIRQMVAGIRDLPLETIDVFTADPRNTAAAESYLRRALEGLLDLGRHVLAKGFGEPVSEYKEVATGLAKHEVITSEEANLLRKMAGYRNRMTHYYDELSDSELYENCHDHLGDIERLLDSMLDWIRGNPERIDQTI